MNVVGLLIYYHYQKTLLQLIVIWNHKFYTGEKVQYLCFSEEEQKGSQIYK